MEKKDHEQSRHPGRERDPGAAPNSSMKAREARVQAREDAATVREDAATARESAASTRETDLVDRESAATSRESALFDREEQARLREDAIRARQEADEIRAEREQLLAQMRDANERLILATVRAEEHAEAAAYNEERFRSLVTTSAALVWHADADGRIRVDADSWRAFTGIDIAPQDHGVWQWLESVHPHDRVRVRDEWARALAGKTPYQCEHRLRAGDRYVWVVSKAVPILRSGVVREWIGMMTDVTDRVRVDEAREQFIGILGHDLRNPLSSIILGAQVLAGAPDQQATVVARIRRSAQRMEALIRDVLDFTRGRLGGGIPVALRSCDLRAITSDVVAEMKQAHPDRDLRCEMEGDLAGECDADRIEQLLSNLLGNAIAHGEDPISVRVEGDPDNLLIVVENRGAPIPESSIQTLFEPFARADRKDHADNYVEGGHDGLGLGLYIVREIVRAHGGSVAVTSTRGDGTRFTVRWPRSAQARARLADR